MKARAVAQNDIVAVKILIQHPMETGRRKDAAEKLIPAHYITEVTATHNGESVFHAEIGPGVSKDPYLAFKFKGGKSGENIAISWVDSKGGSETLETAIV